jgi:peroxiredoxin
VGEEGKPAPEFELTSDSGETVSLASLRGKPVVVLLSAGHHACNYSQ